LPEAATVAATAYDIYDTDLRTGDHVARIIAGERQREPIGFPQLKAGNTVLVYRDPAIAYLPNARLEGGEDAFFMKRAPARSKRL
jgi:hypothetical protein